MNEADRKYTAEDIENGTYFTAARHWYTEIFLSPVAERSYYAVVIALAALNFFFVLSSFASVFPLNSPSSFAIYSDDIWYKLPRIKKLAESSSEDKNAALMKFMIKNYVTNRESYDLKRYEFRYRNIWNYSTSEVFNIYKSQIDASNPLSAY